MNIRRGTTPIITATVEDNIDLSSIKTAWLYISQGIGNNRKIVIDKETTDLTISGKNVSVTLSQEDTLSLVSGLISQIQIRLLNEQGVAYASQREFVSVEEIDKDGEIV